jgi:hypothetical protein
VSHGYEHICGILDTTTISIEQDDDEEYDVPLVFVAHDGGVDFAGHSDVCKYHGIVQAFRETLPSA